jgi:hypothetical protein
VRQGKGGVGPSVPRGEGRKRERGGGGRQSDRGVGIAPGGAVGGSSVHSLQRHAGEQGRTTGV